MFKYGCCWGALGGPLNYCAVCPQEQRQVQVPVLLLTAGQENKLGGQRDTEAFLQPISLRMQWCSSGLLDAQLSADRCKQLGLKVHWSLWSSSDTPK